MNYIVAYLRMCELEGLKEISLQIVHSIKSFLFNTVCFVFLQSLTEEESGCMNGCKEISPYGITAHETFI